MQQLNRRIWSKKFLGVIAVLLLGAAGVYLFLSRTNVGQDVLQSTGLSEKRLTVDGVDYTDPCALLPPEEVEQLFGVFTDTSTITQKYLQRNTSAKSKELTASCTYRTGNGTWLLEATYYGSTAKAAERWHFPLDVASGAYRQKILSGAPTATDNNAAALDEITMKGLDEIEQTQSGKTIDALGKDVVFVPHDNTFQMQHQNAVLRLRYIANLGEKQTKNVLDSQAKVHQAFSIISRNTKDAMLVQRPLSDSTLFTGTVGKTKLFMPCDVLSPTLFKQVFSVADEPLAIQEIAPRKSSTLKGSDGMTYIRNSCSRRATNVGGVASNVDNADILITYNSESITVTPADRQKYVQPISIQDGYIVRSIPTKAAIALISEKKDAAGKLENKFVNIVNGAYTIKFSLESMRQNGQTRDYQAASDAAYTQAINTIVAYLQSHQ